MPPKLCPAPPKRLARFLVCGRWPRRHLQRASEWDAGGRPANRLLSGADIASAKAWAASRPKAAPEPTALHLDFIRASEAEESRQQSAEAKRLRQLAEAQAEREAEIGWAVTLLSLAPHIS
jgi:hypothetical protein